jgi:anti-sigma B factor antagonist
MDAGALSIDVVPNGSAVTLVLRGEIDLSSTESLRRCVEAGGDGWETVTLDMRGVTFMDASGISELVDARRGLLARHRKLELRNVTGEVRRVLELTGVMQDDLTGPIPAGGGTAA